MRFAQAFAAGSRRPLIAALLFAFAIFLAWHSRAHAAPRAHVNGATLRITERDFHIALGTKVLAAGEVRLRVKNNGPDSHELIVVRKDGRLPLRTDGLTVDEETLEHVKAGGLEPGQPGSTRELDLRLRPGRYELFCNMSGHYLGGMHAVLVVR
jgi:hypothetical protein